MDDVCYKAFVATIANALEALAAKSSLRSAVLRPIASLLLVCIFFRTGEIKYKVSLAFVPRRILRFGLQTQTDLYEASEVRNCASQHFGEIIRHIHTFRYMPATNYCLPAWHHKSGNDKWESSNLPFFRFQRMITKLKPFIINSPTWAPKHGWGGSRAEMLLIKTHSLLWLSPIWGEDLSFHKYRSSFSLQIGEGKNWSEAAPERSDTSVFGVDFMQTADTWEDESAFGLVAAFCPGLNEMNRRC